MLPRLRRRSKAVRLLPAAALLLWGAGCVEASSEDPGTGAPVVRAEETTPSGDPLPGPGGPASATLPPDLRVSQVCPSAGYLCHDIFRDAGGGGADPPRLARWPSDQGTLVVALPLPEDPDPARARALHRGAVRGILAWDGQPFPLRVLDRPMDASTPADLQVRWVRALGPGEAGRVRSGWTLDNQGFRFQVTDFVLALEVLPHGGSAPVRLDPDEVERVAAHEMGHALGLGHSDNPGDLMYPVNTARALSPRDYRTLQALYRLPPGARLLRDESGAGGASLPPE